MKTQIYQLNAGYLWVEDREIPLANVEWIHSIVGVNDYITIKNGGDTVLKNAALRHIVDQSGAGYANLQAWTDWWIALVKVPGSGSVTGSEVTLTNETTGIKTRFIATATGYRIDITLTELGFDGDESLDGGETGDWVTTASA